MADDGEWRSNVLRRLADLEATSKDTGRRLVALETRDAADTVHRESITSRLDQIENTLTWLVRLVVGAVILALVGTVLGGGGGVL